MGVDPVIDTDLESVLAAESDADVIADEPWRDIPVDDLYDLSDDLIDALKLAKILTAGELAEVLKEDATLDRFGDIPLIHRVDAVMVIEEISGLKFDTDLPKCRLCRCGEFDYCDGRFQWVEPDLCNACEWLKYGLPSMDSIPAAEDDLVGMIGRELGLFGLKRPPSLAKRAERITAALESVGEELRILDEQYAEQPAFWPDGPEDGPEAAPDGIEGANGWILQLNDLRGRIASTKARATCLTDMRLEVLDEIATAADKKLRAKPAREDPKQAPSPISPPKLTDEQRRALVWMRAAEKEHGITRFSAKSVQAGAATMASLCTKGYIELPPAGERGHGHAAAEMQYRLLPIASSQEDPVDLSKPAQNIPNIIPDPDSEAISPDEIEAGITPGWRGKSLIEIAGDQFSEDVYAERWAELVREALGLDADQEPTVGHVVAWLDSGRRTLLDLLSFGDALVILADALVQIWESDFEMQKEVRPGWIRQSLIDYKPSHPWYYKLGGKPLPVDEINALDDLSSWIDNILATERIPEAPAKRRAKLETLVQGAEKAVERDVETYDELFLKDRSEIDDEDDDPQSASSYDSSMSSAHNHVLSGRTRLAALRKLLADVDAGDLAKFQQMTRNKLAENDRKKGGSRAVSH